MKALLGMGLSWTPLFGREIRIANIDLGKSRSGLPMRFNVLLPGENVSWEEFVEVTQKLRRLSKEGRVLLELNPER